MPKTISLGNPSLEVYTRKMTCLSVHQIQPVGGADPEVMPAVGVDIVDRIVAETVLARLVNIMFEYSGILVKPVQTAIKGSDPDNTVAI